MNLEELRSVQDAERRKSDLQPLRESFYEEAGDYIADLKTERSRAADRADDPFSSTEVRQLSDEIETAEEVLEAIYERRMGKLLKRASLEASDMAVENDGLTAEEQALFEDLVDRISQNKQRVLQTLAGEAGDGASSATSGSDEHRETAGPGSGENRSASAQAQKRAASGDDDAGAVDAASLMGDGTDETPDHQEVDPAPAPEAVAGDVPESAPRSRNEDSGQPAGTDDTTDPGATGTPGSKTRIDDADHPDGSGRATPAGRGDHTERTMVKITDDVGSIYGVDDREYDLSSEDVVTLPSKNADPLVERGAAERLE